MVSNQVTKGLELDPPYDSPGYRSTQLRFPKRPLLVLPEGPTELHGPVFGDLAVGPGDADLTRQHAGEPLGERIVVSGRLLDERGRPIANQLVEVWQANAAGRYAHAGDQHPAPLDANFTGAGRCISDPDGGYRFVTVKPGAYPWRNHTNAWRPAHVHFSVFGRAFTERLVTQMYFPGDPLLELDPIFRSVSERARGRMVSEFELATTVEEWALGYRFDVVVGGHLATPMIG
jgi:protocatechuate 3,4-dioxygenase beta subunit